MAATVANSYARIAYATGRIASSLRSAVESLKQLAKQGSGTTTSGSAAQVATGAAAGAAEGVASFAAAAAMPKIWASIAGSSAAVASSTAATSAAVGASSAGSSAFATVLSSCAASAGGVLASLSAALPVVGALAVAAVAVYTAWKQLDAIWPGIVGDLMAAVQWMGELGAATVRLVNPWTYFKGAVNLTGRALGAVRDGIVAAAEATRTLLVGAANMAVAAWQKLSGLVATSASRVASGAKAAAAALGAVGAAASRGLGAARDAAAAVLQKLAYAGVAVAGLGAAIVGPLTVGAHRFADAGDAADRLAKRAGASADIMSELAYVAGKVGVSATDLADAIAAAGGENQFSAIAAEISAIADPLARAAAAEREFGAAGKALLPFFDQGVGKLAAMRKEAANLGLTFSGPAATSAAELTRSNQLLRDGLQGLWQTVGQAVAPAITEWNLLLVGAVKGAISWAKANQPLIAQVFRVAEAAATAGAAVAAIASTIMPAIPAVLGLATAAAAGGAVWSKYGQSIMAVVGPIITSVQTLYAEVSRVFGGIADAVRAGDLETAVEIAWLGVQTAWTAGLHSLAGVTGDSMGGILNALAAGDWQSAGEQAWAQLQIVFEQGMSALEQTESRLRTLMDELLTHVATTWDAIASRVLAEIRRVQSTIASIASYDPTGTAGAAADALNSAINRQIAGDTASAAMAEKRAKLLTAAAKAEADLRKKKDAGTATDDDRVKAAQARAAADDAVAATSPREAELVRRKAEAQAALAARTAERKAAAAGQQADRDARIAALRAKAGSAGSAAGGAAEDKLAGLQSRLDAALARAAEQRARADAATRGATADVEAKIIDGAKLAKERANGGGATFSAAALVALGGRGPSRIERLAQEQLAKTDEQIEAIRDVERAVSLEYIA